jgi:WD40 repeat protein
VNFSLDGLDEKSKFEYVICNFHSAPITGMDVCIRKQLVVTCSKDKTIRIWNYATRTLEIVSGVLSDETLAVAFHPSGFHVICSLVDKISIYNVLGQEFSSQPRTLQIKACKEIKFSNGGHMFACAYGSNSIWLYNFYTEDCP